MQNVSRLKFIKQSSITFGAIGTSIYFNPFQVFTGSDKDLFWDKAPCRFCGTGCSVMVGVKDGVIMAVKGDSGFPVNQGVLCIKGYALPFIQYGADRLTKLLVRKKNGFIINRVSLPSLPGMKRCH